MADNTPVLLLCACGKTGLECVKNLTNCRYLGAGRKSNRKIRMKRGNTK